MTAIDQLGQTCDGCDRLMDKAKRVHGGRRFCAICYPRLFKRALCSGCGSFARLPKFQPSAKCRTCELRAPCVRCQRTGRNVGLMTPYGPACDSCAPHFRPPEPCDICGELSPRLSRVLKVDPDARCCPKCARATASTCPSCRRHRFLRLGPDGQMQCKLCVEKKETACGVCSQMMPAGRGRQCESCSWEKSFKRRVSLNVESFEHSHTRQLFSEFCQWLQAHMGAHKAALRLKRYLPFFTYVESVPIGIPSYISLLEHFNADGIRRMQVPMLWLKEGYGVEADSAMREEHSEKRRINELILSVPKGVAASALIGYRAYLSSKLAAGSTTLRSVRLSLGAAKGLLATASSSLDKLPTQKTLTTYLTQTPGQKAGAQGFISYLNRAHDSNLQMAVNDRSVSRARKVKLEKELDAMILQPDEGDAFVRTWIKTALMFFHDVARVNKKALVFDSLVLQGRDGFNVRLQTGDYWVPAPTASLRV